MQNAPFDSLRFIEAFRFQSASIRVELDHMTSTANQAPEAKWGRLILEPREG